MENHTEIFKKLFQTTPLITGVNFNCTAAMQGANHVLLLSLTMANERLSRPFGRVASSVLIANIMPY